MDKNNNKLLKLILDQGVLPLFFHPDLEVSKHVIKSLYNSGIRAVEYTNRGEGALENFEKLQYWSRNNLDNMHLGIGTIKNRATAVDFIKFGADFIISPGMVEEVIDQAKKNNLLWIPGCMTPSEIITAENAGAKMVKLFPGSSLGSDFVKAVRSLFPDLYFMPTGGVQTNEDNLRSWFDAGADAVGMGSKLIQKDLVADKAYGEIEESTLNVITIINGFRSPNK